MAEAITKIVGTPNITPPTMVNGSDEQITRIATAISDLPNAFLKHEKALNVPSVLVGLANGVTELSIAFPGQALPELNLGNRSFVLIDWRADGITKTVRLPFAPKEPFPNTER